MGGGVVGLAVEPSGVGMCKVGSGVVAVELGSVAAIVGFFAGAAIATITTKTTNAATPVTVHHFQDLLGFHHDFRVTGAGATAGSTGGGSGGGGGGGGGYADIPDPS
jgi:hypothetical protein